MLDCFIILSLMSLFLLRVLEIGAEAVLQSQVGKNASEQGSAVISILSYAPSSVCT
jgi:hypothetical protein